MLLFHARRAGQNSAPPSPTDAATITMALDDDGHGCDKAWDALTAKEIEALVDKHAAEMATHTARTLGRVFISKEESDEFAQENSRAVV